VLRIVAVFERIVADEQRIKPFAQRAVEGPLSGREFVATDHLLHLFVVADEVDLGDGAVFWIN
jgi:hypothetical protein